MNKDPDQNTVPLNDKGAQTTILLAEDDPVVQQSMAVYLQQLGYRTIETDNGSRALELFTGRKPDILLTDLRMPGLDGLDLLRSVLDQEPNIPVVIVSGMGTMEDAIEALRIGAWDYITKPIHELALLGHAVERALERASLLRRSHEHHKTLKQTVTRKTAELEKRTRELEREIKQRQAADAAILHAKNEWEYTVDSIPDFIALLDMEHRLVRVNKPLVQALGMQPEEMIGEPCCRVLRGREEIPENCPHSKVMQDRGPCTLEVEEDKLGGCIQFTASPFYDPTDNTLIGSVLVGRNMTARKKMEREKEAIQSQLLHAQKLESVGRLAAGIAHEINTPTQFIGTNIDFLQESFIDVGSLITHLQALLRATKAGKVTPELITEIETTLEEVDWKYLAEEIPEAIRQSRDGVQRVTSIVQAMKEFSHPGSRKKERVDINRIVETTVTVARNEWKYVADVHLQLDDNLPLIPCLADEMGQVILNLLVNAAHGIAAKLGDNPTGEKGTITINTVVRDNGVELRMTDTGTGIPATIRKKIFDPFFTTKEVGKGTGQGLAIARDVIVNKHGGMLDVDSCEGEGATFIVHLPGS